MRITVNNTLYTLTDAQLEEASREHTLRRAEEIARNKLDDYATAPQDNITARWLHPFAIHAPWHIDYLSAAVAERFLAMRKENVADKTTWKRAIVKELAARQKLLSDAPENILGNRQAQWLLRPFKTLLQRAWECRRTGHELEFSLVDPSLGNADAVYRFCFQTSEYGYCVTLQNTRSHFMLNLEPDTIHRPTFDEFCKEVRSHLRVNPCLNRKAVQKYIWVRQYTGE